MDLFRKQVIEARHQRLTGRVVMVQPLPVYAVSVTIFVALLVIGLWLSNSQYSRKETVKGYLIPQKGLVKVYSNRPGVVDNLYVVEGDWVDQGEEIVKIKNSQSLSTGLELSVALGTELTQQINALNSELRATTQIYNKDQTRIESQIVLLRQSLIAVKNEKETNSKKLHLRQKQLNNNEKLLKSGFLSLSQHNLVHEQYLEALESHDRLEREIVAIQIEISKFESELNTLPLQKILKEAAITRQISEIRTQLTELDNQYEFIKKAPEAGTVTAIQPNIGTQIDVNVPILSIIPSNSPLEIELLLPTRSAGFVQIGDQVNIRFDAFPYQKFGFITGSVSNIDKALILPSDKALPVKIDEAVYRVRATLEKQVIGAYGKVFPLKVGLIADADIILEKRSLLDWLLDPIYAVKGRLG